MLSGRTTLTAHPNAFTNHTTIEFSLPEAQEAEVIVYALSGEKVAVLFNEKTVAGKRYEVDLDSGALSGGVYFYSLTAPSYNQVEKLILIQKVLIDNSGVFYILKLSMLKACKTYLISFVIFSSVCSAQSTYFNNTHDFYGTADAAFSIISIDSGYIIAGGVYDTNFSLNLGLLYIDNLGNDIWRKDYGQNGLDEYPGWFGSLIQTTGGGYALAGSVTTWPSGDSDVQLWRFDKNGDTLWSRTYIDTANWAAGRACIQTPDKEFIIVGDQSNDMMLIKTDSKGNVIWSNVYNINHRSVSIDFSADGGYVVAGGVVGGVYQAFVATFDTSGTMQWIKYFGGPYAEGLFTVSSTSDGGLICAGDTAYAGMDSTKIYVVKLDSSGNTEWNRALGQTNFNARANRARELSDGSIIVCAFDPGGSTLVEYDILLKLNSEGDSVWMRYIEVCDENTNSIYFTDVRQANDDGFIVSGFKTGSACSPTQDMWVVKTNCLGFYEPPQPFVSDTLTDLQSGLIAFANESKFSDSVLIDFGDGNSQMFRNPAHTILAINSTIVFDTVNYISHSYPDTGSYIVTVTGWACGDTGVFTDTVYIPYYVGINEPVFNGQALLKAYPNPFTNHTTIEFSLPEAQEAEVTVYALSGEKVAVLFNEKTVAGKRYEVDLDSGALSGGVYFYSLTAPSYNQVEKLILIQ